MKPIWMYLDEAIDTGEAKNDSDIARKLGVTSAAVCEWRKGRSAPAEDAAARLAELIGKPEVMAECAAARAKTPEGRRAWERLAKIAAAAMIILSSFGSADTTAGFDGQYAPRIPILTVIRSRAGYTWRRIAELSIRLRRIFQQCGTVRFAASAHNCIGA